MVHCQRPHAFATASWSAAAPRDPEYGGYDDIERACPAEEHQGSHVLDKVKTAEIKPLKRLWPRVCLREAQVPQVCEGKVVEGDHVDHDLKDLHAIGWQVHICKREEGQDLVDHYGAQ